MHPLLIQLTLNQLVQIAIYIIVLAIVWAVIKAVLKLTIKMFLFGCGAILVLGVILVILRLFGSA